MIKAIIFDFDGLILDTEYAEFGSWQQVYGEYGLEMLLDDWTSIIGSGASTIKWSPHDDLKVKLADKYDRETIRERRKVVFDEYLSRETIMPGVKELIAEAEAAGFGLAVASSSPREWVEGFLNKLGLRHHFSVVKTETDVINAKPDPELYLAAMEGLGVTTHEAFALEDSANGTTAAVAAGLFCITVPNRLTIHTDLTHSSLIVSSLADVTLRELCEMAEKFYMAE